ncbi:MAG: hypothetical protein LKI99_06270 [Acetobacter fabarum]|jgi:hypothetical protein|nr:hypothetical protein [Acetobacter fabarum]MCI1909302.1 hypothetical protein [Acetobacter fabarum]MCI1927280.1 hypothetical protein [Acetobacter fabarum]MCI1947280.1 hypothetical protein [Acetobacter fabarum]MCI1988467.1 hypothetical protein [Acetobacter fabarum]
MAEIIPRRAILVPHPQPVLRYGRHSGAIFMVMQTVAQPVTANVIPGDE